MPTATTSGNTPAASRRYTASITAQILHQGCGRALTRSYTRPATGDAHRPALATTLSEHGHSSTRSAPLNGNSDDQREHAGCAPMIDRTDPPPRYRTREAARHERATIASTSPQTTEDAHQPGMMQLNGNFRTNNRSPKAGPMNTRLTAFETKERHLHQLVHSEPDCIQVDFRRRRDNADAVREAAMRLWPDLDNLTKKKNYLSRERTIWIIGCVFVVGSLLNWWFDQKAFGWGSTLMFYALAHFSAQLFQQYVTGEDLKRQLARQEDYLILWCSASASESSFWEQRNLTIRRWQLDAESEDNDAWRAKSLDCDNEIQNLWLNQQYNLLFRCRSNSDRDDDNWNYSMKSIVPDSTHFK